jgi:hypothetical protein
MDSVINDAGDKALSSVEWLGSLVSRNANQEVEISTTRKDKDEANIDGTGGSVYSNLASTIDADENKERQVWAALANLEKDSKLSMGSTKRFFRLCVCSFVLTSVSQQCNFWIWWLDKNLSCQLWRLLC